jgi:MFS superfamily sulfate permease-like transporter
MSLVKGGVVTKYFSKNILNAFTISSSIQIVISQLNGLLGIKIKKDNLAFAVADVKKNLAFIFSFIKHFEFFPSNISFIKQKKIF